MPELPEVESLRRSLLPNVVGRSIRDIEVREPKIIAGAGQQREVTEEKARRFENNLTGATIEGIERRGKQLIVVFACGARVLIHLKMTGQLVYVDTEHEQSVWGGHPIELTEARVPHKHSHLIWNLDHGQLIYNDVRKFGYVLYYPDQERLDKAGHVQRMGREPLAESFTKEYLCSKLQETGRSLKSALMDRDIVAGLGNIYVDETAHQAGIDPRRAANTLSQEECGKLHTAIQRILSRAIEMGGSSVANYILADGSRGTYAREHQVYNRAGQACLTCSTPLEKTEITSRTTIYCPNCQT